MSSTGEGFDVVDFIVDRENLRRCRFVRSQASTTELQPEQALLRVDTFAFTANNVTYASAGDLMSYWDFFPAQAGWGRVPVWGFADVIATRQPGLVEGERLYGYFPMSTHLVVQPGAVTARGFVDASAHRSALPAVYNQYRRVANDADYDPAHEAQQMLLQPLFMTSLLLEDFISDSSCFGARTVVLSSASSKTAFGLAFLLARSSSDCAVIGLTSARNVPFVEGLGCYDTVITYDDVQSLRSDQPAVFVDMAGNGQVVSALHHHLRDNLKHSCQVGATHWERGKREPELPGPTPAFFFAPTRIQKRSKDWGPAALQERLGGAWQEFLEFTADRIRLVYGRGESAVEQVYLDALEGRSRPDEGHLLSLWQDADAR